MEKDNEIMITGMKLQLRSNSIRSDNAGTRIQQTVDKGWKELKKFGVDCDISEPFDEEPNNTSKRVKSSRTKRLSVISDLIDELNRACSEKDLKSCLEMKS